MALPSVGPSSNAEGLSERKGRGRRNVPLPGLLLELGHLMMDGHLISSPPAHAPGLCVSFQFSGRRTHTALLGLPVIT